MTHLDVNSPSFVILSKKFPPKKSLERFPNAIKSYLTERGVSANADTAEARQWGSIMWENVLV